MLIGYARVSTTDPRLNLQTDALHAAGCERLFTDTVSGTKVDRPRLAAALSTCRPGDTLVVWKLDRLGRSLPHLVETVRDLVARGVGFKSLQERIDTTTSGGKLIVPIFASLAEFERDLLRERTNAGLSAARARGRNGGRPKGVDVKKQKATLALKKEGTHSVREICAIVGIARNTYYKYTRAEHPPEAANALANASTRVPASSRSDVTPARVRSPRLFNALLVAAQAAIPLARAWGGGEVASADGLRFRVPVRTLNAGPNPKYFGPGRGVTYYNFTADQFTGFHHVVIPGTLRDSLYILDGLLEQQTSLQPVELMTDTAGYSDVVFGLFWLLGFQFSPRLAGLGESRFWRLDPRADYGPLDGLARQRVNTALIAAHWDDLLRVAGSLKLGTVSASAFLRTLARDGRPTTLARVLGELGRIPKTLHLLGFIDDEAYRRRILTQLNRGEGRHALARALFHGQKGELRQRYREGQEDQLGALGLLVNVVALWNTRYLDLALAQLRREGIAVRDEDMARLSPLGHAHLNLLGHYHFGLPAALAWGQLRSLRSPEEIAADAAFPLTADDEPDFPFR